MRRKEITVVKMQKPLMATVSGDKQNVVLDRDMAFKTGYLTVLKTEREERRSDHAGAATHQTSPCLPQPSRAASPRRAAQPPSPSPSGSCVLRRTRAGRWEERPHRRGVRGRRGLGPVDWRRRTERSLVGGELGVKSSIRWSSARRRSRGSRGDVGGVESSGEARGYGGRRPAPFAKGGGGGNSAARMEPEMTSTVGGPGGTDEVVPWWAGGDGLAKVGGAYPDGRAFNAGVAPSPAPR
uniref:Uncharacterized protein n=1 Tax=Oryza punctata TaxID=4537 RepID=A0A0E0L8A6_ORYPU